MYVKGVQIDAMLPMLLTKASAAARFAGGRGMAFAIHAYVVPFVAKIKTSRKQLKYLAPKPCANIKIKQPAMTMGMG